MPLNLITDKWIPVRRGGVADIIRPDQIAEPGVESLDWPRPDLNLACLELLIGLLYLTDAPADITDWTTRKADAEHLRTRLAPFASAFNLTGDGPLFLQDFEKLPDQPKPLDMLFIDSSGDNTNKNNADLMVWRARYRALSLPLAAMALYTLQAFAPSGGAGNRTSMRGGGPMVTLVVPKDGGTTPLWSMLWANVPILAPEEAWQPAEMDQVLPWMRPTRTSQKDAGTLTTPPGNTLSPEVFFGMPRRLRLVFGAGRCAISGADGEIATGVIQRPYGTNYGGWVHPLTPYYFDAKKQKLPKHPKPGSFIYAHWRGVLFQTDKTEKAACVHRYQHHVNAPADVLVGGWAMDNMKPLDFIWSKAPLFPLAKDIEEMAVNFVLAGDEVAQAFIGHLKICLGETDNAKGTLARTRETFFEQTQSGFEASLAALAREENPQITAENWLKILRNTALKLFDRHALGPLFGSDMEKTKKIVVARQNLSLTLRGSSSAGAKIFTRLALSVPEKRKKRITHEPHPTA